MAESMSDLAAVICEKIRSVFSKTTQDGLDSDSGPDPNALEVAVEEISAAVNRNGRVFVFGVGREGLMMKALCMRLAHLGISAHYVGDMTTPPISSPDLLLASAGPGGFPTVDAICGVARSADARVLLLTSRPKTGSACRLATAIAFLPAQTMADGGAESGSGDDEDGVVLLPMGSVYEGAMFVLFEMVVFRLGRVLGQTRQAITSRHTNLE